MLVLFTRRRRWQATERKKGSGALHKMQILAFEFRVLVADVGHQSFVQNMSINMCNRDARPSRRRRAGRMLLAAEAVVDGLLGHLHGRRRLT